MDLGRKGYIQRLERGQQSFQIHPRPLICINRDPNIFRKPPVSILSVDVGPQPPSLCRAMATAGPLAVEIKRTGGRKEKQRVLAWL